MSLTSNLLRLAAIGALSFAAACSDSNDDHVELRVVHGSPDAPAVDVLLDNSTVLSNVPYKAASGYLDVDPGTRNIKVNAAGTSTTVIDVSPNLQEGTAYTVIATNYLAAIEPLLLVDDREAAADGDAKVRIVHGAPGAPSVDVYVTAPGADINAATPVLTNVPYKGVSNYLTVAAGDYQVRVTVTGTKTVAIDTGTITLASRSVSTGVAVDAVGGGAPFGAVLLVDR